jgi:NAD(P)-dependent dehydrogenase (short-subunit alcohol dehydrogenase family)
MNADRLRRVCLLTGAGGRLGTAFCRANAHRYDILAVYRSRPPAVVSQCSSLLDPLDPDTEPTENAHPVFTVQADLTVEDDVARVVEIALARFGRIDLLVNAAGRSTWGSALDQRVFAASLDGHFRVNVLAPAMLAVTIAREYWQGRAEENRRANRNVVNVSSTAGLYVYPDLGQSAYGVSKAALNFLSLHLAAEFEVVNVRVNAIAPNTFPGLVPTEKVLEGIGRLDEGQDNGRLLVVDEDGETLI